MYVRIPNTMIRLHSFQAHTQKKTHHQFHPTCCQRSSRPPCRPMPTNLAVTAAAVRMRKVTQAMRLPMKLRSCLRTAYATNTLSTVFHCLLVRQVWFDLLHRAVCTHSSEARICSLRAASRLHSLSLRGQSHDNPRSRTLSLHFCCLLSPSHRRCTLSSSLHTLTLTARSHAHCTLSLSLHALTLTARAHHHYMLSFFLHALTLIARSHSHSTLLLSLHALPLTARSHSHSFRTLSPSLHALTVTACTHTR